jgi:hypothetical protein
MRHLSEKTATMTATPHYPICRHSRHIRHSLNSRRQTMMKNYRSERGEAIRRISVCKDSEHGICVAVRLPIPPYQEIRKGRAPVTPL